jgi:glycosyltransferase involved in cell wall biosynthesis
VPEAKSYLVGSTRPASGPVLEVLKEKGREAEELPRGDRRAQEESIRASVTGFNMSSPSSAEHFGIAIAEAATVGLVSVVYRDGGGWTDIASRIDKGLGYISVEEAARTVRSLLNDAERLKTLSVRARGVAKGFSHERFKERLMR